MLKERVTGHFPVIEITGNKNFGSGKETRRTGKPGDRKGKFVSDKIYDDAENIFISLKGCSSPVSSHLRNMHRWTEMSPNFQIAKRSERQLRGSFETASNRDGSN